MNIFICSYVGFDSLHGGNLRVYHLAKELARRTHDLTFVVPSPEDAKSCEKRFGAEAYDVNLKFTRFQKTRIIKYPFYVTRASKKIDKNCDAVFGQSLAAALAVNRSKTSGKKFIDYVDLWSNYWLFGHGWLKGKLVYEVLKKAESSSMKNADAVFTITEKLKDFLTERGCDPRKIRIVRDGVDTKMFRPLPVKNAYLDKYGLEKNVDYVTYQGGIGRWDGVQFLVDAAPLILERNPDARFLIVGDGTYAPTIRRMVKEAGLGDKFIFTGWVPYTDMPFFMNIAKINVVPIPDAPATRGVVTLKLFEAMSCGTPTVIGDLPGVREHMTHKKTAYLVRSEEKESLAGGINALLGDEELHKSIRRNGLSIAPHYDWSKIAKEIADEIEQPSS